MATTPKQERKQERTTRVPAIQLQTGDVVYLVGHAEPLHVFETRTIGGGSSAVVRIRFSELRAYDAIVEFPYWMGIDRVGP